MMIVKKNMILLTIILNLDNSIVINIDRYLTILSKTL